MIYSVHPDLFPSPELAVETISYQDENDQEWQIARVQNGFFIRYNGYSYFIEKYFSCDLASGEHILINNTNCIFIQNSEFDTFVEFRNILKSGYTDDIWEALQALFIERFECDKGVLESEIVK